jgi:hypothetical protein
MQAKRTTDRSSTWDTKTAQQAIADALFAPGISITEREGKIVLVGTRNSALHDRGRRDWNADPEDHLERAVKLRHCQICGRDIKANTGLIAHHGYQRPDAGYQTASCPGARELPYEVSRDAIPGVRTRIASWGRNRSAYANRLVKNPPDSMPGYRVGGTMQACDVFARGAIRFDVARPDGFDAKAVLAAPSHMSRNNDYEKLFVAEVTRARAEAGHARREAKRLQKRYDDWRFSL